MAVVRPREARFARLAVERGILTREEVETLLDLKEQRQGNDLMLWESAVLRNMMDAGTAEKLLEEVGDLEVDKLDKFFLLRLLGRGGMGSVWLAETPEGEKVAVKVLDASLAGQRTYLTRFFREAQAATRLQHEGIVRGLAVGESAGHYYYAMEFVEGETAGEVLEREGPLPPKRATEIILEVAKALAYAHQQGIIHRDIKPDNIMLTAQGRAKLADLGLARLVQSELTQLTASGTAMGTPTYMAPEQCRDAKRADARSDIYSLGATWYHLLVGSPPFTGGSALEVMQKHVKEPLRWPRDIQTRVPRPVVLTIERMMSKAPNNRIQTMEEVVRLIETDCLGQRDIFKELGVKKVTTDVPFWHVKVRRGDRLEIVNIREDRLRVLLRRRRVPPDAPARRADERGPFVPIEKVPELAVSVPTRIQTAVPGVTTGTAGPAAAHPKRPATVRGALHDLVTHYDRYERKYRRKKQLKRLAGIAIKLFLAAVVVAGLALAYKYFSPRILEYFRSRSEARAGSSTP